MTRNKMRLLPPNATTSAKPNILLRREEEKPRKRSCALALVADRGGITGCSFISALHLYSVDLGLRLHCRMQSPDAACKRQQVHIQCHSPRDLSVDFASGVPPGRLPPGPLK